MPTFGTSVQVGRGSVGPALQRGNTIGSPIVSSGGYGGYDDPESFVYVQTTPASVITVKHDLGFRPNVSLFNSDYSLEYSEFGVQHLSLDELRVSMDLPTACVVVMS